MCCLHGFFFCCLNAAPKTMSQKKICTLFKYKKLTTVTDKISVIFSELLRIDFFFSSVVSIFYFEKLKRVSSYLVGKIRPNFSTFFGHRRWRLTRFGGLKCANLRDTSNSRHNGGIIEGSPSQYHSAVIHERFQGCLNWARMSSQLSPHDAGRRCMEVPDGSCITKA